MFFTELLEYNFSPSEHFHRLLTEATTAYSQEHYETTIAVATRLIILYPKYASRPYFLRGCAHLRLSHGDAAVVDFSRVLDNSGNENRAALYFNRGLGYYLQGSYDQAVDDLAESLRIGLEPAQAVEALIWRGHVLVKKGEFQRAERNYLQILSFAPERKEEVYNRIAYAYLHAEDFEKTIQYLTEVIQINPAEHYAYANRAYALMGLDRLEEALADANEAIRLDPENANSFNNRGEMRRRNGDWAGALEDYSRSLEIEPDFAYPHIGIGDWYFVKADYSAALDSYRKALELKPESVMAKACLAITHHALGQVDEALKLWRELSATEPDFQNTDWLRRKKVPEAILQEAEKLIARL